MENKESGVLVQEVIVMGLSEDIHTRIEQQNSYTTIEIQGSINFVKACGRGERSKGYGRVGWSLMQHVVIDSARRIKAHLTIKCRNTGSKQVFFL